MMTITITIKSKSILQHDYDRAHNDCERGNWTHRIVLDPNDKEVDVSTMYGNGTPKDIWDGRAFVLYTVGDGTADVTSLVEELESEDIQDSLQAIVRGYSEEWDGSNYTGWLAEDAHAHLEGVIETLGERCSDLPMYWDADEYFTSAGANELVPLALEKNREDTVDTIVWDAVADGYYLDKDNVDQYLDSVLENYCHKCYEGVDYCTCDDGKEESDNE